MLVLGSVFYIHIVLVYLGAMELLESLKFVNQKNIQYQFVICQRFCFTQTKRTLPIPHKMSFVLTRVKSSKTTTTPLHSQKLTART